MVGNPTLTSSTTNGTRANIVNDAKTGQPIALSSPSGVLGQYQYDGSGNIWGTLVDNPAAFDKSYDPYGTSTVAYNGGGDGLPSNPFGFKAGIEDTHTGLVKFGLRWYNPYLGSWTQRDSLDSPLDPSNGNRYAYAASDPINGLDPTGQQTYAHCVAKAVGAAAGVAALGGAIATAEIGAVEGAAAGFVLGGIGGLIGGSINCAP